jgi:hypothetical protein
VRDTFLGGWVREKTRLFSGDCDLLRLSSMREVKEPGKGEIYSKERTNLEEEDRGLLRQFFTFEFGLASLVVVIELLLVSDVEDCEFFISGDVRPYQSPARAITEIRWE